MGLFTKAAPPPEPKGVIEMFKVFWPAVWLRVHGAAVKFFSFALLCYTELSVL